MLPAEYSQKGRKRHGSPGNTHYQIGQNTPCITPYTTAAQETRVTDCVHEPDSGKLLAFSTRQGWWEPSTAVQLATSPNTWNSTGDPRCATASQARLRGSSGAQSFQVVCCPAAPLVQTNGCQWSGCLPFGTATFGRGPKHGRKSTLESTASFS